MLAFGGTRTWHRLTCAIEDAGFEIRDSVADLTGRDGPGLIWAYGSGFPKSHNVSAAIDKAAGATREVVGYSQAGESSLQRVSRVEQGYRDNLTACEPSAIPVTAPATEDAVKWAGWGTALKPAWEPIVVARKPLAGTVAQNVLEYGTGALNIDGCRVACADKTKFPAGYSKATGDAYAQDAFSKTWTAGEDRNPDGRWPPNVLLSHAPDCEPAGTAEVRSDGHHPAVRGHGGLSTSGHAGQDGLTERKSGTEMVELWDCAPGCPVAELDRQSGVLTTGAWSGKQNEPKFGDQYGDWGTRQSAGRPADSGGASRFFPVFRYQAKATSAERPRLADGTAHPTVKPRPLMEWLVRLITRPGGVVLDLFAGSGPTAEACIIHGFRCVLIEQDETSCELIRERLRKPIQPDLFGGAA
jgi:site-specific DNA-methyltransferase (adenine-specific)